MNKALAIQHLYPNAVNGIDFIVQDDSDVKGQYIAKWNVKNGTGAIVTQPTDAQLQTSWDQIKTIAQPPTTEDRLTALESAMISRMGL